MRLRSCDAGTVARFVLETAGSSPSIAVDGNGFARTALLAQVLGRLLPEAGFLDASAYSAEDAGVDVRVWMDDPGGFHAHFLEQEAAGTWVPGRWVASVTPEDEEELAAVERSEQQRRERADVLFAAVEGFDSVARLRFMSETGCDFALWDEHNGFLGEIEDLLPIPVALAGRIREWAVEADGRWSDETPQRGTVLAQELREVLGPGYRIDYLG
jgi:hypothetical protein